ncbi:MAG TPA: hypothetical protein VGC60_11185, partial [Pyrinomonadaceae bacterium]
MRNHFCHLIAVLILLLMPSAIEAQHARPAMGAVDFPVSCSRQAQTEFNRAITLLHHMTYPQARVAFQHVAAVDPKCAMAHWG